MLIFPIEKIEEVIIRGRLKLLINNLLKWAFLLFPIPHSLFPVPYLR